MRGKNAAVNQYLKEIGKKMAKCPKAARNAFLAEIRESIERSEPQNPKWTLEKLYADFGSPEEISNGFYDREDYKEFFRKAKKNSFRWKMAFLVVCILFLMASAFAAKLAWDASAVYVVTDPY